MASNYDININIDIESANLGELEKEFGRLNEEIKKIPRNSAAFQQAAGNIKKVSGELDKANTQLQKLDVGQLVGDFAKVGAAIGAAGLVFQQFTEEGSADNEELQKTLERTQAILGLVALAEGAVAAQKLISTAATKAQTIAQNLANKAVDSGAISLKGLRTALIATGIGAFAIALGLVVANFDKIQAFFNGNATDKYNKDLKAAEETQKQVNANLAQQLAFNEKLAAEGENTITNLERALEYQKDYEKEVLASNQKILNDLINIQLEQGRLTDEQRTKQLEIFAENEKVRTDTLKAERSLVEARLKEIEDGAKQEIEIAKIKGKDTTDQEKKSLNDRIALLKQYGTRYEAEIKQLEGQVTLIEEQAREERRKKAEAAAKERRDRIKGELQEIAQIIQQDPQQAISLLADEEQRALDILQKYSKGSKDITAIIKELEKQGLTPLANQFKALSNSANFEQFQKLIEEYYGDQTKATVDSLVESLINTESQVTSVASVIAGFDSTFKTFSSRFFDAAVAQEGGGFGLLSTSLNKTFFDINKVLEKIRTTGDNVIQEYTQNVAKAISELEKLRDAGVIDEEEYRKRLTTINNDTVAFVTGVRDEVSSGISQAIEGSLAATELASAQLVSAAENNLSQLEGRFFSFSDFAEIWSNDVVRDQIKAQRAVLDAQDAALAGQAEKLKLQKQQGVITETEYAAQIDAIDQQLTDNQIARQKLLNEERKAGLEEFLAAYQEVAAAGQAVLDFIQSENDLRAAQADEEIAIEEKKLQRQLANEKLTEEERVKLEEESAAAIAKIEIARDEKIAKAQIAQARLKFALDVASILVNSSLAIVRALAELGPIAGPIAAAAIGASTGLQIAAANNAKNSAIAQANALVGEIVSAGGGGSGDTRQQFADGGYVSGPGTSRSDSIPARLSNGEYVINAASTARFLPLLDQINNVPRNFQNGGMAGSPDFTEILMRIERRLATPPKAYVVTSELTEALDTEAYLQRRATLT